MHCDDLRAYQARRRLIDEKLYRHRFVDTGKMSSNIGQEIDEILLTRSFYNLGSSPN
jgi:hypothetical protein